VECNSGAWSLTCGWQYLAVSGVELAVSSAHCRWHDGPHHRPRRSASGHDRNGIATAAFRAATDGTATLAFTAVTVGFACLQYLGVRSPVW